jgi:hypothetical protein
VCVCVLWGGGGGGGGWVFPAGDGRYDLVLSKVFTFTKLGRDSSQMDF